MVTLVIFLIAIMKLSKVFFALEGVGENFERQRTHRSIVLLHLPRRQVGGSHQVRDLPHREQRKGKHWRCTKKTFTEVPGLSGPLSPPSFLSSLPSPCIRSSRPGDENRGNERLCFPKPFFHHRTHKHGILSANTTSRMESSANGMRQIF